MKNLLFLIAISFIGITNAQSPFDKLEDNDQVTTVVITKQMFNLLKKFPDAQSEDMELFNTIKGLNELKIFTTQKETVIEQIKELITLSVNKDELTELIRIKEKGANTKIYVKATEDESIVSEVLMFINDKNETSSDATVILLTGIIDVNKIAKIAAKMSSK